MSVTYELDDDQGSIVSVVGARGKSVYLAVRSEDPGKAQLAIIQAVDAPALCTAILAAADSLEGK